MKERRVSMLFVTQTRIYHVLVVLFWGCESLDRQLKLQKNSNVIDTRFEPQPRTYFFWKWLNMPLTAIYTLMYKPSRDIDISCLQHITVSRPIPSVRSTSDINNNLNKPHLSIIIGGSQTTSIPGVRTIQWVCILGQYYEVLCISLSESALSIWVFNITLSGLASQKVFVYHSINVKFVVYT